MEWTEVKLVMVCDMLEDETAAALLLCLCCPSVRLLNYWLCRAGARRRTESLKSETLRKIKIMKESS